MEGFLEGYEIIQLYLIGLSNLFANSLCGMKCFKYIRTMNIIYMLLVKCHLFRMCACKTLFEKVGKCYLLCNFIFYAYIRTQFPCYSHCTISGILQE